MMSRITLSLRKNAREDDDDWIDGTYKTGFSAPLNPPPGTQSVAHWTFGMGGPNEDQTHAGGDDIALDDDDYDADFINLTDFETGRARRQSVVRKEQSIRIDMNPQRPPPTKDFSRIRWDGKAN